MFPAVVSLLGLSTIIFVLAFTSSRSVRAQQRISNEAKKIKADRQIYARHIDIDNVDQNGLSDLIMAAAAGNGNQAASHAGMGWRENATENKGEAIASSNNNVG